jgi:predicted GNAT family acetyltransferase
MDADVTRNDEQDRYELHVAGELVSIADFRERPGAIVVPHVETKPAHRGNGYAEQLMAGVVDDLIARSLKIVPLCPFANQYVSGRPDADDLIAM